MTNGSSSDKGNTFGKSSGFGSSSGGGFGGKSAGTQNNNNNDEDWGDGGGGSSGGFGSRGLFTLYPPAEGFAMADCPLSVVGLHEFVICCLSSVHPQFANCYFS